MTKYEDDLQPFLDIGIRCLSGSFELILRLDESPLRGVSGTAGALDLVSLEALEKTPCIGLH